ncbi:MAG: MBL fold metallo-hydrolase [Clostridiales bacterium]|nr:MBL fold metallo-hydrolase [Clostridiales bacterium]
MAIYFCSLASGSSGNCQYIASETTGILLDAGLSGKYINNSLESIDAKVDQLKALFITHEHSDHVKSAGILMRKYGLTLYLTQPTFERVESKLGKYDKDKIIIIEKDKDIQVGDITVHPFAISHDAIDCVAYSFTKEELKISIVTDLGYVPLDLLSKLIDSNLLMLESNHDVEMLNAGRYPYVLKKRILSQKGHISNETAGETIVRVHSYSSSLGHVVLGHLSQDNNTPELAFETVKSILEESGLEIGEDISLDLAYRDRVGKLYKLD